LTGNDGTVEVRPVDDRIRLNLPLLPHEVPDLRAAVGWDRADADYPGLFERLLCWAGARDEAGQLIAFGYVAAPALSHGYLEDIMVHPQQQRRGLGIALVRRLLTEAQRAGVGVISTTYRGEHRAFYERCGFQWCDGGVWRPPA
jgi:GNAT superfamily N-acetyltransferase